MSAVSDVVYPYTRYFSDVSVQQITQTTGVACDFITLLTSIQQLKVDILPITWQATQQLIGAGGTSNVSEALQNVNRSFAFKRIADKHKESESEGKLFRMVLNEITILSHNVMRKCPNIIELEGICWDIESEFRIWPVLVFDKTHWGDLRTFVRKPPWMTLPVAARLHLGTEIGNAISYMHDNNMIHGDIKPENVLIYKDGGGMFTARLTDFGYSTTIAHEHDCVYMPKSWPWFAPEHHHRGFRPEDARKMDMFSFGMLTLWVLYEQYLSGALPLPHELQWANTYFSNSLAKVDEWVLDRLKQKNELVPFAQQLISVDEDLEESVKPGLLGFSTSILQCKPEARVLETRNSALAPTKWEMTADTSDLPHGVFQLGTCIISLYRFDYRIRKRVRHALEQRHCLVTNVGWEDDERNISFQLALCYKIGFGGAIDEELSADQLLQSARSTEDLIETLNKLETTMTNDEALPGQIYAVLERLGDVRLVDLAAQYRKLGILDDAKAETQRELTDVRSSLGTHNALWTWTATLLAALYSQYGQWKEAEELYLEVIQILAHIFDSKHPSTLIAMANAADCFRAQEAWKEAEKLDLWVLETRKASLLQERVERVLSVHKGDHYITEGDDVTNEVIMAPPLDPEAQCVLSRLSQRISDCLEQHSFDDADALQLETLETLQRYRGEDDISLLTMMRILTEKYINRKQWDNVETLQVKELEIHRKRFGDEHSRTLASFSNLTLTIWNQGRQQEARTLQEKILETCERVLEPEHSVTETVISNLMNTYRKLGQEAKSAEMRDRLFQSIKDDLSQDLTSHDIVNSMGNLARTYRGQGRWVDAEELQVQVLELRIRKLGHEHPETQQSAAEMSLIEDRKKRHKGTHE